MNLRVWMNGYRASRNGVYVKNIAFEANVYTSFQVGTIILE